MNAIRIEDLSLVARGKPLVQDFSLALNRGEKCTLAGQSGAGKSTLLRCVLGFARPSAGRIVVEGTPLDASSVWSVRRRIAWVAQEPELPNGSARSVLEQAFQYRANRAIRTNLDRAGELAARFRLAPELLDEPVSKLSGGEKQRVALIAALLLNRPILLLDEVSSALDAASRAAVREYLSELRDTTILSVTHEPENFSLGRRLVELPVWEAGNGSG